MTGTDDIDRYLARAPAHHRAALDELRRIIHVVAPDVEEMIRVGVPAFKVRGRPLASIGSATHHVALYLMYGTVIADHADQLGGYDTSKTVVRFDPAAAIPKPLVAQLLQARLRELGFSDTAHTANSTNATDITSSRKARS